MPIPGLINVAFDGGIVFGFSARFENDKGDGGLALDVVRDGDDCSFGSGRVGGDAIFDLGR